MMTIQTFFQKVFGRIIYYSVDILPDELYLKLKFRNRLGYCLNLKNPKTFSEKLQWLKLESKNHPEYTNMVDKVEAKRIVASKIGEQYVIPTLGVWNSVDEIDWHSLPNRFVIKNNGDSGGVVVCKDKADLDIEKAKRVLQRGFAKNVCKYNKEYPYLDVPPRILAEEYLEDDNEFGLKDYKIFCFDGEPKFLFVATDRQKEGEEVKFDFFDLNWNHLNVKNGHENSSEVICKPKNFSLMLNLAKKLSEGIPHVRVDFYNCDGNIYFGELTFFHFSGFTPFVPRKWDYDFGEYLHLPNSNN